MSKTFASRSSSVNTRGRGRGRGQVSGQSTPQVEGLQRRGLQEPGPVTRSKSRTTTTAGSTTNTSRRMYNNRTLQDDVRHPPPHGRGETSQSQASPQQGEHMGAFTMFQPNTKKRQQVNEMAQRETAAYEKYKRDKKPTNLNYVGTTGGGIAEEMARNRQSHDNRFQKLKRQQRQEDHRQAKRDEEQRDINRKRQEARRKADQNELRGTTPDPEDLRRRREAFLSRLENQTGTD